MRLGGGEEGEKAELVGLVKTLPYMAIDALEDWWGTKSPEALRRTSSRREAVVGSAAGWRRAGRWWVLGLDLLHFEQLGLGEGRIC